MNKEEILNKYIDLIDKGYCSDCNELNCIDNFPHEKITHAIRELQQENQELKERIDKSIRYINNCVSSPDIYEQFISRSETKKLLEILTGGDKMKLEKVRDMSDDELRKYLSMFGGKM